MTVQIAIVAGEASGDILGAGLIVALRQHFPDAVFHGIGGPRMIAQGFRSYHDMERLSVMGIVEPLKRLPELLAIRKDIKQRFSREKPAVFIGIDSPDFVLNIESHLKQQGVPTVHYVSPSVWAWRKKRIFKIKSSVDLMLTLFPFETAIYEEHGVPVRFIGHPLADQIVQNFDKTAPREQLSLDQDAQLCALMPGSRASEVSVLAPMFFDAADRLLHDMPSLAFVLPAATPRMREMIEGFLRDYPALAAKLRIINGESQQVMQASDAILMASGTTSLEALLINRPMVIAYKVHPLSFKILSKLVKIDFIGLPNLLAGRAIVPEFIQNDARPEVLANALKQALASSNEGSELAEQFAAIHRLLALDSSATAAQAIKQLILQRSNNESSLIR